MKLYVYRLLALSCLFSFNVGSIRGEWDSEKLPITLQVGYAVRCADINNDGKKDIVIVDSKRIVWLQNPTWETHEIYATPDAAFDNVCIALHDIDQDGQLDAAIGTDWQFTNSDSGGKIGLLFSPKDPRQPWAYRQIDSEPTTHRMTWADTNGDTKSELFVLPLKGRGTRAPDFMQSGVRVLQYEVPADPRNATWTAKPITEQLHVAHNLDTLDFTRDGKTELVIASFEGLTQLSHNSNGAYDALRIGSGQEGAAPAIGSSEVKLFADRNARSRLAVTIEPWHGDKVVLYTETSQKDETGKPKLWNRKVIDQDLKWGHAVAWGDFNNDSNPEIVAGVRDDQNAQWRCGVRVYHYQANGEWKRELVNPGEVAVEDLVVEDIDGDGKQEIIAVGRATHNAVIYRYRQ